MIPHHDIEVPFGTPAVTDWQASLREGRNPPRVWLVDDSHEFRGLLARLLADEARFDCSREFASSRAMLAALAQETPPDVILLDVQMGEECGLDAIRPIRSLAGATHVIMLTTCFDSLYQTAARKNGATDFLLKSYSLEQIAERVWQALEQPIPVAESLVAVVIRNEELCAGESARGGLNDYNLFGRAAKWKTASSRLWRGGFFGRLKNAG